MKQKSRHFSPLVEWLANVVASERPDAAPNAAVVIDLLTEWGREEDSVQSIYNKYSKFPVGSTFIWALALESAKNSESRASR